MVEATATCVGATVGLSGEPFEVSCAGQMMGVRARTDWGCVQRIGALRLQTLGTGTVHARAMKPFGNMSGNRKSGGSSSDRRGPRPAAVCCIHAAHKEVWRLYALRARAVVDCRASSCNLVDPASSHMLVSKIKPCMSKYKLLYGETANGSLKQLSSP